ncbi:MAG: hypothetical protein ACPIOQ_28670, partial [Promethearchaeia archaeon]
MHACVTHRPPVSPGQCGIKHTPRKACIRIFFFPIIIVFPGCLMRRTLSPAPLHSCPASQPAKPGLTPATAATCCLSASSSTPPAAAG